MSFSKSKLVKRYEYFNVDLQTPIKLPGNNINHDKSGYKFNVDSSSETHPLDWFNSYLEIDFKITKMDDTGYGINDEVTTINGISSLISQMKVDFNGTNLLDTMQINHCINVKNLVEFSQSYSEKVGPVMFHFPDTSTYASSKKYTTRSVQHGRNDADNAYEVRDFIDGVNANYNMGFSKRK